MRKIKACVDQKDRIVCVTVPGSHEFYYQPTGSGERTLLFTTPFSGSVFTYFRDKGRNMGGRRGFSLTIREIYKFDRYYNVKLTAVVGNIPAAVDRALRCRIRKDVTQKGIQAPRIEVSGIDHRETSGLVA